MVLGKQLFSSTSRAGSLKPWLDNIGLGVYYETLNANGINTIQKLSNQSGQLASFGITDPEVRRKLIENVQVYMKQVRQVVQSLSALDFKHLSRTARKKPRASPAISKPPNTTTKPEQMFHMDDPFLRSIKPDASPDVTPEVSTNEESEPLSDAMESPRKMSVPGTEARRPSDDRPLEPISQNEFKQAFDSEFGVSDKYEITPIKNPHDFEDMHLDPLNSFMKQKMVCNVLSVRWRKPPDTVLVITKPDDERARTQFKRVYNHLHAKHGLQVLVDPSCASISGLQSFDPEAGSSIASKIDFIITLGGDGTLLFVNSLFPKACPPVLPFNVGSLGFLTPFPISAIIKTIDKVIEGGFTITRRSRLVGRVMRRGDLGNDEFIAMNEVLIDRGYSSYLTNLMCSCNDKKITTVQGDGLILATSTGSTAYSLSAGGSPVHPAVPAILLTPICSHALTTRPIILPSNSMLKVAVPPGARSSALVSFDGRARFELMQGDAVVVQTSAYPISTVNCQAEYGDWFEALTNLLNWNKRVVQLSLDGSGGEK